MNSHFFCESPYYRNAQVLSQQDFFTSFTIRDVRLTGNLHDFHKLVETCPEGQKEFTDCVVLEIVES